MRKLITAISVAALAVSIGTSSASAAASTSCATIKDGTIKAATGETITTGTDQFGYNYQAHSFNGTYDGLDRNLDGLYYGAVGRLRRRQHRHEVERQLARQRRLQQATASSTVGSLTASLVVLASAGRRTTSLATTLGADGEQHDYTIFEKIEYVGAGGSLWGGYEVTQSVVNDPYAGLDGVQSKVSSPGFGQREDRLSFTSK